MDCFDWVGLFSLFSVICHFSGKVQRVFFRKHAHAKATELGLLGYCANTKAGTVVGEAIGPADAIDK